MGHLEAPHGRPALFGIVRGGGTNSRSGALNGLAARNAFCLLVGCMLTVLDEAPSDGERCACWSAAWCQFRTLVISIHSPLPFLFML
jgi:hypothetical protein